MGIARLRRSRARAQAAAEFAFLAASLTLLLGAAIEMGRLGYLAMTLDDAARAGAQYGSQSYATDGDTTGMKSAATTAASNINGAKWWDRQPGSASRHPISADAATVRWSPAPVAVHQAPRQSMCRSKRKRITSR
jgi:Flp pilus assembly protein TadG